MPRADSTQVLKDCRTLAVVGLSANPGRVSHSVCAYMVDHGYRIIGVNPNYPEVFGETCHPSLTDMPEEVRSEVELVVVFRRPEEVPELLNECADLGLKKVWLQLGVASAEALEIAEKRELEIVEEQCLMVVHSLYSPH